METSGGGIGDADAVCRVVMRRVVWSAAAPARAMREFEHFYDLHRPHQGISNARPLC